MDDGDETNADWLKAVDLNRFDADDGVFDNIDFYVKLLYWYAKPSNSAKQANLIIAAINEFIQLKGNS